MAEKVEEASVRRREAARALLRLRASSRDIRDWLPDEVIVILDEDLVGTTFEYLEQHHAGEGYLVRLEGKSRVEVVEVQRSDPDSHSKALAVEETPIHPGAEIGMLFAYLRSFPGQRLRCIAEQPIYEVAIAPDGGLGDLLISQ